MRRFIVLIVMLVVPLQLAWAATVGLHGHVTQEIAATGFHAHDDDHHHETSHPDHDSTGDTNNLDHNEDGYHCHIHPVFTCVLMESGLKLDAALSGRPMVPPPAIFFSRIPPPLDRPPLARV